MNRKEIREQIYSAAMIPNRDAWSCSAGVECPGGPHRTVGQAVRCNMANAICDLAEKATQAGRHNARDHSLLRGETRRLQAMAEELQASAKWRNSELRRRMRALELHREAFECRNAVFGPERDMQRLRKFRRMSEAIMRSPITKESAEWHDDWALIHKALQLGGRLTVEQATNLGLIFRQAVLAAQEKSQAETTPTSEEVGRACAALTGIGGLIPIGKTIFSKRTMGWIFTAQDLHSKGILSPRSGEEIVAHYHRVKRLLRKPVPELVATPMLPVHRAMIKMIKMIFDWGGGRGAKLNTGGRLWLAAMRDRDHGLSGDEVATLENIWTGWAEMPKWAFGPVTGTHVS